jgi:CheY-like chemotaxis protein
VILDWEMPGVDGPGFLAGLAERPDRAAFGVVVVSSEKRQIDRKSSPNVLSVLQKPLDPSEILGWAGRFFRAEGRSSGG